MKDHHAKYKLLFESESLLHLKYNCISLKNYEYLFVQYMGQFEVFKFEEIKKFNMFFYNYFYFTNDLTRHFASFFCERNPGSGFLRLKSIDWGLYFASPLVIEDFLRMEK